MNYNYYNRQACKLIQKWVDEGNIPEPLKDAKESMIEELGMIFCKMEKGVGCKDWEPKDPFQDKEERKDIWVNDDDPIVPTFKKSCKG